MPHDIQDTIANLRFKIADQEKEIVILERNIEDLKADLADFEDRYNKIIKPLSEQIDAAKSALNTMRDLLLKQQMGDSLKVESLWRGNGNSRNEPYIPPHERDFAIPEPIDMPKREHKNIKALYRQLARLYHPDLGTDEADRERRTKIMSLINTAYQDGDIDSLITLDESTADQKTDVIDSQIPLDMMVLRGLQGQFHGLAVEIQKYQGQYEWSQ